MIFLPFGLKSESGVQQMSLFAVWHTKGPHRNSMPVYIISLSGYSKSTSHKQNQTPKETKNQQHHQAINSRKLGTNLVRQIITNKQRRASSPCSPCYLKGCHSHHGTKQLMKPILKRLPAAIMKKKIQFIRDDGDPSLQSFTWQPWNNKNQQNLDLFKQHNQNKQTTNALLIFETANTTT